MGHSHYKYAAWGDRFRMNRVQYKKKSQESWKKHVQSL